MRLPNGSLKSHRNGGIGWIPYVLEHMDVEWEEQFQDLRLTMRPSDYWHRQCFATYSHDRAGLRLLDTIGAENVISAAIDNDVPLTIALSTDKAVNPVNLYGATKLCAEKIVAQANAYASGTRARFASVLRSST